MVLYAGDDRTVLLGLGALGAPLGISLEGGPFLFAVGQRLPFEEVIESLVRIADRDGPETGLLNAVALPDPQCDRVEALQEVRQAAGHAVVDAQFIEHVASPSLHR